MSLVKSPTLCVMPLVSVTEYVNVLLSVTPVTTNLPLYPLLAAPTVLVVDLAFLITIVLLLLMIIKKTLVIRISKYR